MDYSRQSGIVETERIKKASVSIIGAGATGSFVALTLAKLGVENLDIYDVDGITEHNLPNQFYRNKDVSKFKIEALNEILVEFSDVRWDIGKTPQMYKDQPLLETVITCTDTIASRKIVWEQFLRQPQARHFIDCRMGGELGIVYAINKKLFGNGNGEGHLHLREYANIIDIKFYEETLNQKVVELPCSERSIIYCVLMIASLVGRAFKAIITGETIPREMAFSLKYLTFLTRK